MAGRPRIERASVDAVVALKDKGYSHERVAEELDVSLTVVNNRLREAGKHYPVGRPKGRKNRVNWGETWK